MNKSQKSSQPLLLAVVGICFLMVMMDNTILNVALETIQKDLGATTSQLQWAVDAYILLYAALMFTAGVVADRWGRRRTLVLGLLVFAAASAMAGLSGSPGELIGWRAVMGLGGAVVPPTTLAIIKDAVPEKDQPRAMGIWSAVGGMSVAFGPIIGGALLERFAWGSVFWINVPIAIACVALLFVAVRESRSDRAYRFDVPGLLLSTAAIGLVVYGVINAGEHSDWLAPSSGGLIALGVLVAIVLVAIERRTAYPALDVSLFRSAAFTAGTTAISAAFFALTGGTFLLVFYVQLVLGYSPLGLGVLLLPVAAGSVVAAIASTSVVRHLGYRTAVSTGLVLLLASVLTLLAVSRTSPLWWLEGALLVAGLGMGMTMGSTTPLVMSAVERDKAAVGSAVNNTLRQVGAALGVAVMGSMLTTQYRSGVDGALGFLPPPVRDQASDSLGATLRVLQHGGLPGAASGAADAARDAFVTAMHTTLWAGLAVLALGLVVGLVWAPRRSRSRQHAAAPAGAPSGARP